MLSDQLVMLPWSSPASSRTHKVQVPFGARASKVDRLTFADWVGAGATKPSLASGQLAGRQEPEEIASASGSWLAASSSSTRLAPTIPFAPPASDITVAFVDRRRVGEHDVDVVPVGVRDAVDREVDVGDRPAQPGDDAVRGIGDSVPRVGDHDRAAATAPGGGGGGGGAAVVAEVAVVAVAVVAVAEVAEVARRSPGRCGRSGTGRCLR